MTTMEWRARRGSASSATALTGQVGNNTLDYPMEPGFTPMPEIIPGSPPDTDSSTPVTDPTNTAGGTLFQQLALTLFPGLPLSFVNAFADIYATYEDQPNATELTMAALRDNPQYQVWFPGNLRDDGTVRVSEGSYWTARAEYEAKIRNLGLEPSLFADDQYVSLIVGDVTTDEFGQRVRAFASGVLERAADFRSYFAEQFNIAGVSDRALLSWAFNNNYDALVRDVTIGTVGFEGELRGFDVGLQLASSLYDAGIQSQGQAIETFGAAAEGVPLFGRLAQRHFDADDDFDLGEFLEAAVFDDQEQLQRQRRLIGQERSMFSQFRPLRERRETGAVVGLTAE